MDNNNTAIGFIGGLLGGTGSYTLLQIQETSIHLAVAVGTALLCGFAGIAGKDFYYFIKHKLKKK